MYEPRKSPTLVEMLRARTALRPEQVLFTYLMDGEDREESVTYAELDRRARAIAVRLWDEGIRPGDRVLLIYNSDLRFIAGFFGCLYAGAVAVPGYPPRIHKRLTDPALLRLVGVAKDCDPRLMLTSQSVLERVGDALPEIPGLERFSVLASDAMEHGDADDWTMPAVGPETLAFLQYTSGSTGDPKGAMLTHGNLTANLRQIEWSFRLEHGPTVVGWLPLHHDMGLIGQTLGRLYDGGRLVFMSPASFIQRPQRWMRAVSNHAGTTIVGPDFGFRLAAAVAKPEDVARLELSQLTSVINGAEPIAADTLAEFTRVFAPAGFRPAGHYPCYGMAEASVLVSGWHPGVEPTVVHLDAAELEQDRLREVAPDLVNARPLVGCGIPPDDTRVVIADPQTGEKLGPGRIGEIWVSGPSIAAGYWRKPEINTETFGARTADGDGPFYRTGDLGFVRERMVFVTGRIKDLIIIDGRNHYPQDIERTVEQAHECLRPGGSAAFSFLLNGIERLVVVAEVDRGAREVDCAEVGRKIRGAVSMVHEIAPYEVVLLKTGGLPKTSSGKVQRRACRQALHAGELRIVGRVSYEGVA